MVLPRDAAAAGYFSHTLKTRRKFGNRSLSPFPHGSSARGRRLFQVAAMPPTNAEALEPFRRYLEVLARVHLDPRLRGKLDPADLVQQTLLRACAALPEVRGRSPEALAAWLCKILARTLADTVKHYHRDRRDVNLE